MQNKITFEKFVGFGNIVSLYYHHSYEDSFTNLGSVDYDQVGFVKKHVSLTIEPANESMLLSAKSSEICQQDRKLFIMLPQSVKKSSHDPVFLLPQSEKIC